MSYTDTVPRIPRPGAQEERQGGTNDYRIEAGIADRRENYAD
jgi:hypothetical protein